MLSDITIEWRGPLSDLERQEIAKEFESIPDAEIELQSEKALLGTEAIVNTIIVALLKKVSEKAIEALTNVLSAIKRKPLRSAPKKVDIHVTWADCDIRVTVPLNNEKELRKRLDAIRALISK